MDIIPTGFVVFLILGSIAGALVVSVVVRSHGKHISAWVWVAFALGLLFVVFVIVGIVIGLCNPSLVAN